VVCVQASELEKIRARRAAAEASADTKPRSRLAAATQAPDDDSSSEEEAEEADKEDAPKQAQDLARAAAATGAPRCLLACPFTKVARLLLPVQAICQR
jgi:hypothetical protein